MGKFVCVIGAGVSGLCAVKTCLEEGLEPKCFEKRSYLGGTWNSSGSRNSKRSRAYQSVIANNSKEALCFSDFPFPKEFPPFPLGIQLFEYLKSYASHFELEKFIEFNSEVEDVARIRRDGELKWIIRTRNIEDDSQNLHIFDCVIICVGLYAKPIMPSFEGLADGTFKGKVIHACEYESSDEFKDKKVVVIGLGNSGADIASDISGKAEKTVLSIRSGGWMVTRVPKNCIPMDMCNSRLQNTILGMLPEFIANWMIKKKLDSATDTKPLGIRSRYEPADPRSSFFMNDELPTKIVSGRVMVKPDVTGLRENQVFFSDGTKEQADVIVCATGYDTAFPFVSDNILPDKLSKIRLYQWIVPFEIEKPESLALIGVAPRAPKSSLVMAECQVRYAVGIMAGVLTLPPVDEMRRSFKKKRAELPCDGDIFRFRTRMHVNYSDEIAVLGGFYPYFWKILLRDFRLAFAVQLGPELPYHYRLLGRHTWSGVRERIMNAMENTMYALQSQNKRRT